MTVTQEQIAHAIRSLGLSNKPLAVHASLRSFGTVEGGAETVIHACLQEGCTLLVPTFSSGYEVAAPPDMRPQQNGCGDYSWMTQSAADASAESAAASYDPGSLEIDRDSMGAIPAAVLQMPGSRRGRHPLNSFAAIGPMAEVLIAGQQPDDVYAPLRKLAESGGDVVLMGVGLERLTLLHLAEQLAGRTLFRRWARDASGAAMMVEVGSCSEGFGSFAQALSPLARHAEVGASRWQIYDAAEVLSVASAAIRETPSITHCGDPGCDRCHDAVLGGPIL
jgi:aminoglycoside N3'-acetyltransferase